MLDAELRQEYFQKGYLVLPQLFKPQEVEELREHYMSLRQAGSYPGDGVEINQLSTNLLEKFPRMIHMHHWDEQSLQWLLDQRLATVLTQLLGQAPLAVQTMIYFKPPGARGQALHQDQYYLRVQPGTSMAAWLALDPCDEANGCLQVVPGSHNLPLLCTIEADLSQSFTNVTVPLPEGFKSVPVHMEAGDVLFFNGQLIHGSHPNHTTHRYRRSLIAHYVTGDAQKIARFYKPVLQLDGTEVKLEISEGGDKCGVWIDEDGTPVVEMRDQLLQVSSKTE